MRITGRVVLAPFAAGSKSEHEAVWLETDKGRLKLRRVGGNPFRDPALLELVGHRISACGRTEGNLLFLDNWDDLGAVSVD